MAEDPQSSAKQGGEMATVNLDNFLPPVKTDRMAKMNSPRSLMIVKRLGYHSREVMAREERSDELRRLNV